MKKAVMAVAAVAVISSMGSSAIRAAELDHRLTSKRTNGHIRTQPWLYGCTAWYYCYPLYGAYGPYGGTSYWGAYTEAGWGYRHW